MSTTTPLCQCLYPSWKAFPRIHYFERRYSDLLTRCKRVLGRLPESFINKCKVDELDKLKTDLETGVEIIVIGKELPSDFLGGAQYIPVQETKTLEDANRIKVIVYNLHINKLDVDGFEAVYALLKTPLPLPILEDRDGGVAFLLCEVGTAHSQDEVDIFRHAIQEVIVKDVPGLEIHQRNIFLGSEGSNLKEKISEEIERKIMRGFQQITLSLQPFDLAEDSLYNLAGHILDNSTVVNSVLDFVRNPFVIKEILDDPSNADDEFLEAVLCRVCRTVKCAAVTPLAKKHSLTMEACNRMLHEIQFEEALARSVSKNTRHHLETLKRTEKRSYHHFDFLLLRFQKDMGSIFEKTEEKLSVMKSLSMVVRRLMFEIEGYMKQSTVIEITVPEARDISEEFRRDILNIKGVYGVGNIYGKLEIHITGEMDEVSTKEEADTIQKEKELAHADTSAQILDDTQMETDNAEYHSKGQSEVDVRTEIAFEMKKHNFYHPYTVRLVRKRPVEMLYGFDPGDTLHSRPSKKSGTLGAFVKSNDNLLYGLTCAHVVSGCNKVFVQKDGMHPFGICPKIVETGQDECRLIDIAALKVIPSLQDNCVNYLETNVDRVRKVEMVTDSPSDMVRRFVHKFGAKTGLTTGLILSVDYSNFGPKAEDYVVIIDPLAAGRLHDIPKLSRAFTSLLQSSDDDTSSQAHNIAAEEEGAVAQLSIPHEAIIDDTVFQERTMTENSEPEDRGEENKYSEKVHSTRIGKTTGADKSVTVVNSVLNTMNSNNVIDDMVVRHTENPNIHPSHTNSFLYVRNVCENALENCTRRDVFAERGDSGSVICAQNPLHGGGGGSCVAVSMLSGGDLEVEGMDGKKSLSFLLKDGLSKLSQRCRVQLF